MDVLFDVCVFVAVWADENSSALNPSNVIISSDKGTHTTRVKPVVKLTTVASCARKNRGVFSAITLRTLSLKSC